MLPWCSSIPSACVAGSRVTRERKRSRLSVPLVVGPSPDMKADRAALARTYSGAMEALSQRYPEDVDAATLYAESLMNLTPWKLWTLDGKPINVLNPEALR